MSTPTTPNSIVPITDACRDTLTRLNLEASDAYPTVSTAIQRLSTFARALDLLHMDLDPLAQTELEDLAIEYTLATLTAERLENLVGDTGDLLALTKSGEPTQKQHPALAQAAKARARMRQIHNAIKKLQKTATKQENEPKQPQNPPKPEPQPEPTTTSALLTFDDISASLGLTPEAPSQSTTPTPTPTPTTSLVSSTPPDPSDPSDQSDPHSSHASHTSHTPPMNRTQRRAHERAQAKAHRKAQKRARYLAANQP